MNPCLAPCQVQALAKARTKARANQKGSSEKAKEKAKENLAGLEVSTVDRGSSLAKAKAMADTTWMMSMTAISMVRGAMTTS